MPMRSSFSEEEWTGSHRKFDDSFHQIFEANTTTWIQTHPRGENDRSTNVPMFEQTENRLKMRLSRGYNRSVYCHDLIS
jgi:hypothetical protein